VRCSITRVGPEAEKYGASEITFLYSDYPPLFQVNRSVNIRTYPMKPVRTSLPVSPPRNKPCFHERGSRDRVMAVNRLRQPFLQVSVWLAATTNLSNWKQQQIKQASSNLATRRKVVSSTLRSYLLPEISRLCIKLRENLSNSGHCNDENFPGSVIKSCLFVNAFPTTWVAHYWITWT
jgi:hypothetical protein